MYPVPQFMGECHYIARFAHVVEHHIGMHGGDGRMRKGAGCFTRLNRGINPALGEKRFGDLGHLWRKLSVG